MSGYLLKPTESCSTKFTGKDRVPGPIYGLGCELTGSVLVQIFFLFSERGVQVTPVTPQTCMESSVKKEIQQALQCPTNPRTKLNLVLDLIE